MVSEEREHVGNLAVNVFPILAEGGRAERLLGVLTKHKGRKLQ